MVWVSLTPTFAFSQAFQDTIIFSTYGDIKEPLIFEGKKDVLILGKGEPKTNGIKTFNNNPFLIKIKDSENIEIRGIKIGYGIKNQGESSMIVENSKNISILDCFFTPYSEYGITIDEKSSALSIKGTGFEGSHHAAIKTGTSDLEIWDSDFGDNNVTGSILPDIDEGFDHKKGLPIVRRNGFKENNYQKHIDAMKGFVEVKESTAYRFNCFKIVKKIELGTGDMGKLTAYYEGENNKVLDLLEFETSKKSGYLGGKIYVFQDRPVMCQTRTAQYDFSNFWFVYGNLFDAERVQGKKNPVSTPLDLGKGRNDTEEEWYKIMKLWLELIKKPEEKFSFDTPLNMMTK